MIHGYASFRIKRRRNRQVRSHLKYFRIIHGFGIRKVPELEPEQEVRFWNVMWERRHLRLELTNLSQAVANFAWRLR